VREEREWLARMQTKPKLRTYVTLKHELTFEHYLTSDDIQARHVMTRLRRGTNELRIETGRYPITNRDRRLEIHERICLLCLSGEIEDEKHFVLNCTVYDDLRKKMFDVVKRVMLKEREEIEDVLNTEIGKERIFRELMAARGEEYEASAALCNVALAYCKAAMKGRKHIVVTYLDQKT